MNDLQRRMAHLEQLPARPARRVWDLDLLSPFDRGALAALTDDEVDRGARYAQKAGVAS
jgi:hypothetical protein